MNIIAQINKLLESQKIAKDSEINHKLNNKLEQAGYDVSEVDKIELEGLQAIDYYDLVKTTKQPLLISNSETTIFVVPFAFARTLKTTVKTEILAFDRYHLYLVTALNTDEPTMLDYPLYATKDTLSNMSFALSEVKKIEKFREVLETSEKED